ncbi:hypothetical protein [Lysobacter gummosus]|uniref:hypothetical protein n=1 Tax=Lysobacter gummosus TaxID=262324 RepID=UPI00363DAF1D
MGLSRGVSSAVALTEKARRCRAFCSCVTVRGTFALRAHPHPGPLPQAGEGTNAPSPTLLIKPLSRLRGEWTLLASHRLARPRTPRRYAFGPGRGWDEGARTQSAAAIASACLRFREGQSIATIVTPPSNQL